MELSGNNLTFTLVFLHNCCVTKNLTHLRVRAVFASLLLRKNPAPKSSTYFRTIPYLGEDIMDLIILAGSSGNGKTTVGKKLHELLKSPFMEFTWIPEFRALNPHKNITPKKEEEIAFENMMLVCKNYLRHKFENIIVSDFNDVRLLDIPLQFRDFSYVIITLYSESDESIKERIINRMKSKSENDESFDDYEFSIKHNKIIANRKLLPNEYRVRTDSNTVSNIAECIINIAKEHQPENNFVRSQYSRDDYNTYFNEDGFYN